MPTTRYIYHGNQYLCEADGGEALTKLYVNEPGGYTNLVSQKELGSGEVSYPLYDALGTTRTVNDETGDLTDTFAYDAWGNVLDRTGSTDLPFQYVGERGYYRDAETDLSYVMARIYNPRIIRWLSGDPIGFVDRVNLYAYASNRPILYIDPAGLQPQRGGQRRGHPPANPCPPGQSAVKVPPAPNCFSKCLKKNGYGKHGGTSMRGINNLCNRECSAWRVKCTSSHGPVAGLADPRACPVLERAIAVVNSAINGGGECQDYFNELRSERHEAIPPAPFYVVLARWSPACLFFPSYTTAGSGKIYVCESTCCESESQVASLLLHEVAHQYCPSSGERKEACPTVAQDICSPEFGILR